MVLPTIRKENFQRKFLKEERDQIKLLREGLEGIMIIQDFEFRNISDATDFKNRFYTGCISSQNLHLTVEESLCESGGRKLDIKMQYQDPNSFNNYISDSFVEHAASSIE